MSKRFWVLAAFIALASPLYASLQPVITFSGNIRLSVDATGTNNTSGSIRFNKPSTSATVRAAYLLAASTGGSSYAIPDNQITLNGVGVVWDPTKTIASSIGSFNHFANVTDSVRGALNGATAGISTFPVSEGSRTASIDGTLLAIVWDDPTAPATTITLLYGAQNTTGDQFSVTLAQPVDKTKPGTTLDMSLGISYGFQSLDSDTGQWSYLRMGVNGTIVSESAGGQDDCRDAASQNGCLITAGGIGDTNANPDPTVHWIQGLGDRTDDELYNLLPFLNNGDTSFTVSTLNPSNDDNVFFAAITLGGNTAIVGEGILLSPASSAAAVGVTQTVSAHVQSSTAQAVAGRLVNFRVISGPNLGLTGTGTTNANGDATFDYSSLLAGSDTVEATMINSAAALQLSNLVSVLWRGSNPVTASLLLSPTGITNPLNVTHVLTAKMLNNLGSPVVNQTVTFTATSGPNQGLLGTGVTNASGIATRSYVSNKVGTDTIVAATQFGNATLSSNSVTKSWAAISGPTIFLSPASAVNPINGRHFLTAAAFTASSAPASDVAISIKVMSGPNAGKQISGTTGAAGTVDLFYDDQGGAGTDSIVASGSIDSTEVVSAAVSKVWSGLLCDADGNGQVDNRDILMIQNARNTLVLPGDPRDSDFNGFIAATDARKCATLCLKAACAQ